MHYGFDDLMLFRNHDRVPLWWSSEFHSDDRRRKRSGTGVSDVTLQPDGDLVAPDEDCVPLWSTGTAGRGAQMLEVRGNGDVVLLDDDGEVLWHTNTATAEVTPPPFPVARGDRFLVGRAWPTRASPLPTASTCWCTTTNTAAPSSTGHTVKSQRGTTGFR